ncbi:MAG: DNA translocase FtsK [Bacteroidetes bacterium]|nr:MAG: DNA translocase FtsK [Bacteroidota bacterium]
MTEENTYRPEKDLKSEKKAAKKPESTEKKSAIPAQLQFKGLMDRLDKKKTKTILGAVMVLLSFYFFFACLSYFFTWKQDQNLVLDKSLFGFIFESSEEPISNWFGKMGAWVSHLLIYRWFGISSFLISFMLFIIGFKWMLEIKLLPIKKTVSISLVSMIWFSLFMGYFAHVVSYLGGSFGFHINAWLTSTFGKVGALLFILILLYILLVALFNPDFKALWQRYFGKKDELDEYDENENLFKANHRDAHIMNPVGEDDAEDETEEALEENVFIQEETPEDADSELEIDASLEEEDEELEEALESDEHELSTETSEDVNESDEDSDEMDIEVPEEEAVLSSDEAENLRKEYGEYDPKLDLSGYLLPPLDLLKDYGNAQVNVDKAELETNKNKIVETLAHYKIDIAKIKATVGPTVTLYEIVPAPGVRISKIKNLEDDIALSLAALGIRIIAPIPGKGTIGIEVPNSKPEMVSMRSLIASEKFQNSDFELPVVIGKTITNETYTFDLTKMPHLLVAGATGQGKSVGLNAILISILYKKHPAQVKFVLVDPKKVELTLYNRIERHFLAKLPDEEDAIITDTSKVVNTLNSLCIEMDERYELLKDAQVRTIKEYNVKFVNRRLNPEKGHRYLPYIVVLIDEFADLIMTAGKEVEHPIARIAQLARAVGIHLIVATQRPSVNVITGMIKANFPARIAFRVLSKIDSRTILDASGADQLIGRGDMLISTGSDVIRLQCGFVDTPEVEDICTFIGEQRAYPSALLLPEYVGESADTDKDVDLEELDAMFVDAARIVVIHQQGSASLLQRKLKLGYNRAGRIVDQLEGYGIIGAFQGSKAREVLFADEVTLDNFLQEKGLL